MQESRTFVEAFRRRVDSRPEKLACVFLDEAGAEIDGLTYADLDARSRALAVILQDRGLRGERALLLFPPGLEFVSAFLGCLYGGVLAVPAYPPRPRRPPTTLLAIAEDARPRAVLTTAALLPRLHASLGDSLPGAAWLATDATDLTAGERWREAAVDASGLAFLQYTSGSTAVPKGVRVTHAGLLANERMIAEAFEQDENSIVVSWLPLFHDMGLIGGVLQPLYQGGRSVLMSPAAFLQRPARWLEAISRYRATTSGGPDFGYDLCVRKLGAAPPMDLDLSSWRVAFSGAETVHHETLERFAESFAGCGFRRQAFVPCYGLAEATLFVAAQQAGSLPKALALDRAALGEGRAREPAGDARAMRLMSCGRSRLDGRIAIVEPSSRRLCEEGEIGEIWFSGASVADGYWNRPEETCHAFAARVRGTGEGPFLRTGDLGCLIASELFITGRLKDLIIVRGRNHYPQDLERTVERSHPALRPGCSAAFAVESGDGERLVLLCEAERHRISSGGEMAAAFGAIRAAVAEEHELQVGEIVLLCAGTIPKTSSGKIRRAACKTAYLENLLEAVGRDGAVDPDRPGLTVPAARVAWRDLPEDEARHRITALLTAQAARCARVSPERLLAGEPLGRLGIDSLAALEWRQEIEESFGVSLPLSLLSDAGPAEELATEVLARLAAEPATGEPALLAVGETVGHHPMSYGQRSLWFLDRLAPASRAYHIAAAGRVDGPLSVPAMADALSALVARHPVLRTTFAGGEEPSQHVHSGLEPELQEIDAAGWEDERLRQCLAREADRPFDLASGPLLRVTLFHARSSTAILLVVHHIVCDLWSLEVMVRELGALYEERAGGQPAGLAPLTLRYSDFARWQLDRMGGMEGHRLFEHWRRRLDPLPPRLELPTDRPQEVGNAARADSRRVSVDAPRLAGLERIARLCHTTLSAVLVAAFEIVLARSSGQDEFALGLLSAGRSRAELADLAGYFVNPLALPARVAPGESFADLLGEVRHAVLDAFDHQDLPLPLLVERLRLEREAGRAPLFQVLFALQRMRSPETAGLAGFALGWEGARIRLGSRSMESIALAPRGAQFDLTLVVAEVDGRLGAALQFDADRFDGTTAERLLAHWQSALAEAITGTKRPLGSWSLLTAAERHQVLIDWNDTAAGPSSWNSVPQLFAAQAARVPDSVAVSCEEQFLSYGELERSARRLASRLRRLGVGPDSRVGVCVERSAAMVVAFVGVLAAGGAYVPMDPSYPSERLRLMVEDSGAEVLIGDRASGHCLPAEGPHRVLLEDATGTPLPLGEQALEIQPENLAHVIYTSGSTGRPKGVGVSHRALVNVVQSLCRRPGLTSRDVLLSSTSISFDVAVAELCAPLAVGARLVVARQEQATEGARLAELALDSGATVLPATPTTLRMLVESGWRGGLSLWSAGEALTPSLGDALCARSERVWNLYGPTEAAIYSLVDRVRPRMPIRIGRGVENVHVAILDRELEPAPLGIPGELFLAGRGLARGYWGRSDLTAERFVPIPFGSEPGDRAYRTGDLARWCPDGTIEYLGRIDQQVKVRGNRIEPGEVEGALAGHPAIRQAVVGVRPDAAGEAELVAWLVTEQGVALPERELREDLRRCLPAAFVPSRWVFLESLPLSPNGKVDRRRLPAPGERRGSAKEVPQGLVEQMLAEIWRDVLGVEAVGREDDFFALGGHSLAATRVIGRVREAFGVDLTVRSLLETPRLAHYAERIEHLRRQGVPMPPWIERREWGSPEQGLLPEEAGVRSAQAPLSFAQEQLWLFEKLVPGTPVYHLAAGFHLRGCLGADALSGALEHLVRRHEVLRTRFAESGARPFQEVEPAGRFVLSLVDLSGLMPAERQAERSLLVDEEARRPFDLGRGRLLRTALFRTAATEHLLLVVQHHIVSDAWSVELFLRELAAAYPRLRRTETPVLPDLPIRYRDYAAWQREWLSREEVREREVAYWRERLGGLPEALDLPADRPRPALPTYRGGRRGLDLPRGAAAALCELGRRRHATPFMILLAAFHTLLGRSAGQHDLCLGVPFAGRGRTEVQSLIGLFVNTLVLRADLAGNPTFLALLAQVAETALGAHDHADLPFEVLVRALRPERDPSRNPLFQVLFNWIERPQVPELPELQTAVEEFWLDRTKFDLTLTIEKHGNRIGLVLAYARDLFDDVTAGRWISYLEQLLLAALEEPDRPIGSLPLLSPGERWQAVGEWARGEGGQESAEGCLHELFEAQARRSPDAIAAVCEPFWMTYRELDEQADRLAAHLRGLGVGLESRVGLSVEPSIAMLPALLAILKAGGAYVPLSAQFPPDRQLLILEDSGARLLITARSRRAALAGFGGRVWVVDHVPPPPPAPLRPGPRALPGNAAYVIYTSGSTGRPKGVLIEHRQIVEYVRGVAERLDFRPGAAAALVQPIAVDASKTLLFGGLANGCLLHLISAELATDATALSDYFRRHPVDLLKISPSHLAALHGAAGRPQVLMPHGWLMLGGESSRRDWVDELQTRAPGCTIVNHYGPTEATVGVLTFRVTGNRPRLSSSRIPMGYPLPDSCTYLLDPGLEPVGIGIPGQLYIGGRYLARGYLDRPDLTAAVFLPDPFSTEPGARLYRTGDLARRLSDGALEFLGRVDNQLKVRGFRIEPGEIEATLGQHPAVREVVLSDWSDRSGNRRLVAYWVGESGVDTAGLRRFLKERIPEFMVPAAFVRLEHLPRLPHGKIDFKALPEPAIELRHRQPELPIGEVEKQLAAVLSDVLGVDQVGVRDNFFELGGDSILSIQIAARANRLGLRLTPRQIFQYPTVAELARVAGAAAEAGAADSGAVEGPVPLTPIQAAFFERDLAEPHHFNQAVLLGLRRQVEPLWLERAFTAVVAHHDALWHRFARDGESWSQRASAPLGVRVFGVVDLGAVSGRLPEPARGGTASLQASFDLERGPLVRAVLFRYGAGQPDRLLIVAHHLVVDGVSWRILLEDIALACDQQARGHAPALPAKTTSYQRWAEALTREAGGERVAGEVAFWLEEDLPSCRLLPVDFCRGENTVATERSVAVALDGEETAQLLRASHAFEGHLEAILLAALAGTLRDWAGLSRVLVDLEGHGREVVTEDLDLVRTVGWFTAIYPVSVELGDARRPVEVLERVSRRLGKLTRGGLDYGLARFLRGDQSLEERLRRIQAEVKLNYLGQLDQGNLASDVFELFHGFSTSSRSPRGRRSHTFDLTASVAGGRFRLDWTYSSSLHEEATVSGLAARFCGFLRAFLRETAPFPGARAETLGALGMRPTEFEAVLGEFEFEEE